MKKICNSCRYKGKDIYDTEMDVCILDRPKKGYLQENHCSYFEKAF